MAESTDWRKVLARLGSGWLQEDRIGLLLIVFAAMLQAVIAWRILAPGELAGDDMSIHLAEIAGIARSLASGDLDLWNPSANAGFASGYFYQFLPQLACAIAYLFFGWLVSLSALFKLSVIVALIAIPLAVFRGLRVTGFSIIVSAAGALGASTVFASSGWGAGIDSLFSTGLYTQAFALIFYPLALAYCARYLLIGKGFRRALIYTLLTGFCHPFIAFAIAPVLLFVPWWRIGLRASVLRSLALFAGALLGSAPLWLPIIVHYDAFGGFPKRVPGEEGIPFGVFVENFHNGRFLDVGRRAVTTALVGVGLGALVLRRGRRLIPLYLAGATFAALIMLGPVVGKTEGDLLPAVRFLAPMQMFLGAAAWSASAVAVLAFWRWSTGRERYLRIGLRVVVGALALLLVFELGKGVAVRADDRIRTVHSFPRIKRAQLGDVIDFLKTQPPGRVLAASEFGSGSHWWMYLPYVEAERPAMRAYGGAALQSSPNFVYLRTIKMFRHLSLYGTRYVVARVSKTQQGRYKRGFDRLATASTIIYERNGYRVYRVNDAALFRAVRPVATIRGDRKAKTAQILEAMNDGSLTVDQTLVEDDIGAVAAPTSVTFRETRHSRREHQASIEVAGDDPALVRLAVTYHPGWRATVDGHEVEVLRVSPAFVAIKVPPGAHDIRLVFERPLWTWLLYLLLIVVLIRVRRRPTKPRGPPRATIAVASVALAVLALPKPATAEPNAHPRPVDAAFGHDGRAIVATTSGLFVRKRSGEAFSYLCPEIAGSETAAFEPRVAVRSDGTMAVTSYRGLRQSSDGCQFELAPVLSTSGTLVSRPLWFSALEPGTGTGLWATTADGAGSNDIYRSASIGEPFVSAAADSDTYWYLSVKRAGQTDDVFATGYRVAGERRSRLFRVSPDGPTELAADGLVTGVSKRTRVLLAPSANELFVVADAVAEPTGDVLYHSRDGGQTFRVSYRSNTRIVGLIETAAGGLLLASESELLLATSAGSAFASRLRGSFGCLVRGPGGEPIVCDKSSQQTGVALNVVELKSGSAELRPWLTSSELGPPCGPAIKRCSGDWARTCKTVGANCKAPATEPRPVATATRARPSPTPQAKPEQAQKPSRRWPLLGGAAVLVFAVFVGVRALLARRRQTRES